MQNLVSFHKADRLVITADDETFDQEFLRDCEIEGFETIYLPFQEDSKRYAYQLNRIKESLSVSESYGVIAFGNAAAFCLDHYLQLPNNNKLCALIAYYPAKIPHPEAKFPESIHVVVHFARQNVDVDYGPRGMRRRHLIERRRINTGLGTGNRLSLGYLAYAYPNAEVGFAEYALGHYDRTSADLAWSRTLKALQAGFRKEPDLEKVWEDVQDARYFSSDPFDYVARYQEEKTPSTFYAPSLQGVSSSEELRHFYETVFGREKLPSMNIRLLSRTIGADRVVDELYMSFIHSQSMDWILPGVPPTNRQVDVILISIVSLRGGKLYSEHVHWNQASVLTQVGLLNPELVPSQFESVKDSLFRGKEAAMTILNGPG